MFDYYTIELELNGGGLICPIASSLVEDAHSVTLVKSWLDKFWADQKYVWLDRWYNWNRRELGVAIRNFYWVLAQL